MFTCDFGDPPRVSHIIWILYYNTTSAIFTLPYKKVINESNQQQAIKKTKFEHLFRSLCNISYRLPRSQFEKSHFFKIIASEKSTDNVIKRTLWISDKKSKACFIINGVLILLVIVLTTSNSYLVDQYVLVNRTKEITTTTTTTTYRTKSLFLLDH